ncbi:MAG: hypothetical protein QM589_17450 [Thermomicrobiales bacterium]
MKPLLRLASDPDIEASRIIEQATIGAIGQMVLIVVDEIIKTGAEAPATLRPQIVALAETLAGATVDWATQWLEHQR